MSAGSGSAQAGEAGWLWAELGLEVEIFDDAGGSGLHGLVGLALRRNPRRAYLLVSRLLGKHLPVAPARALGAGALLADKVAARLRTGPAGGGTAAGGGPLVVGYCETATALGHAVADGLPGADYLHTTRRRTPGSTPLLTFVEPHSHARWHWLTPADPAVVRRRRPLVLVDDEVSTGETALGTVRTLQAYSPRSHYVVAALFDARPPVARAAFDALAAELGVPVDVVSLLSGTVRVPPDVAERAQRLRERLAGGVGVKAAEAETAGGAVAGRVDAGFCVRPIDIDWPADLPDGARHGWDGRASALLADTLPGVASRLAAALRRPGGRTLVLGTEEFMYTPMRIAAALADAVAGLGGDVVCQSTTRSPVHPVDVPGYAIRTALTFPAPEDPDRASHLYNVWPGRYDEIVVVVDHAVGAARGAVSGSAAGAVSGAVSGSAAGADAGPPGPPGLRGLTGALRRCAPVAVVTVPSFVPARAR
jgi:hypothetical protein